MLVKHERHESPLHVVNQAASTSPARQLPRPNTVKARLTSNGHDARSRTTTTPASSAASCAPTPVESATATSRPWPSCSAWPRRSTLP
jgi:hypothetical protein